MSKYQTYYRSMVEENQDIFKEFKLIHDRYSQDPEKWQSMFNHEGKRVTDIIREWERRLCSHSERGKYGVFSSGLADKFWAVIRKEFPKIDYVGVTIGTKSSSHLQT